MSGKASYVYEAAQLWLKRGTVEQLEKGAPRAAAPHWCGFTSAARADEVIE